jgi:deoxyadenosine/deoxycytidine kinase
MEEQMDLREKYIGISGNIGSGKTTLCEELSKLGYIIYNEPVESNPFLDDFYNNPKEFAFIMQIYLLTERYKAIKSIIKNRKKGVQDRTIYEDMIFVLTLYKNEIMSKNQKLIYENLFNSLMENTDLPDFLIYLDIEPKICLERIKERGRLCEKNIELKYLEDLHNNYKEFIDNISKKIPVFILNENSQNNLEKFIKFATALLKSDKMKSGLIYL